MNWTEFSAAAPELAELAEERFARDQLVMLGTLRVDGSPRISPCEVDFASDELLLGMMWQSRKAKDLLRDPRIVVHSVTCNREGTDGDVKLYGRVREVLDPETRQTFRDAIKARIDWAPDEPDYHLFALDVDSAGYVRFAGESMQTWRWTSEEGFTKLQKRIE
jgi:Pyridoxamine 5'-phosphate oxidase